MPTERSAHGQPETLAVRGPGIAPQTHTPLECDAPGNLSCGITLESV